MNFCFNLVLASTLVVVTTAQCGVSRDASLLMELHGPAFWEATQQAFGTTCSSTTSVTSPSARSSTRQAFSGCVLTQVEVDEGNDGSVDESRDITYGYLSVPDASSLVVYKELRDVGNDGTDDYDFEATYGPDSLDPTYFERDEDTSDDYIDRIETRSFNDKSQLVQVRRTIATPPHAREDIFDYYYDDENIDAYTRLFQTRDGEIFRKNFYVFDQEGRQVTWVTYLPDGTFLRSNIRSYYPNSGLLHFSNNTGNFPGSFEYIYNGEGLLEMRRFTSPTFSFTDTYRYYADGTRESWTSSSSTQTFSEYYDTNGFPIRLERDVGADGTINFRQLSTVTAEGRVTKLERDADNDGTFDYVEREVSVMDVTCPGDAANCSGFFECSFQGLTDFLMDVFEFFFGWLPF